MTKLAQVAAQHLSLYSNLQLLPIFGDPLLVLVESATQQTVKPILSSKREVS
jgi:hypothetical protein